MLSLSIILPAAGTSSRMGGRDKLMEEVDDAPLLRRQAMRAIDTGCDVIVTLPPQDRARHAVLEGLDVTVLNVKDAGEGMAASLRAASGAAARDHALMILLPDMPDIRTADLDLMLRAFAVTPGRVLRAASAEGQPGHPVILPARLHPRLAELTGDTGARDLIEAEDVGLIRLAGTRALTDLDTPEDWADWRAEHN